MITSSPLLLPNLEREYQYDATGFDPDDDYVIWNLESGPEGMTLDPFRGTLRWTPRADQLGEVNVEIGLFNL